MRKLGNDLNFKVMFAYFKLEKQSIQKQQFLYAPNIFGFSSAGTYLCRPKKIR
jgi:hypothetical protein